uniref:Uncharacterized protein n=1 Tax=Haptolina ericina TaxID=156174 RepID=A0A7S3BDL1_9EUKA
MHGMIDYLPPFLADTKRNPRFMRLQKMCRNRDLDELGLPPEQQGSWTKYDVDRATLKLSRILAESSISQGKDISLWELLMGCSAIRPMQPDQCERDGLIEALVIFSGLRTMTVGRVTPIDGDNHHVGFLSVYKEGMQINACGAEPYDGLVEVSQINDAQATVYFELSKVYRKYLAVEQQLAKLLEGHLGIHSDATAYLYDLRELFRNAITEDWKERGLDSPRYILDLINRQLTQVMRDAASSLAKGLTYLELTGTPGVEETNISYGEVVRMRESDSACLKEPMPADGEGGEDGNGLGGAAVAAGARALKSNVSHITNGDRSLVPQ